MEGDRWGGCLTSGSRICTFERTREFPHLATRRASRARPWRTHAVHKLWRARSCCVQRGRDDDASIRARAYLHVDAQLPCGPSRGRGEHCTFRRRPSTTVDHSVPNNGAGNVVAAHLRGRAGPYARSAERGAAGGWSSVPRQRFGGDDGRGYPRLHAVNRGLRGNAADKVNRPPAVRYGRHHEGH